MELKAQCALEAVLVSHAHLDHIRDLATIADNRCQNDAAPLVVAGTKQTLAILKKHFFNDLLWPDFSRIPSARAPGHPVPRAQAREADDASPATRCARSR